MTGHLEGYSHLWARSDDGWALLHVNRTSPEEMPRYLVVNCKDKTAMIIEDGALANEVKEKMLAAGVPIVWPGNGF